MLHLYIGNKNYSSWSLRPWLVLKVAEIPFEETVIPLFTEEGTKLVQCLSPSGKVPLLKDGALAIWDSLAINEYLSERYPEKRLWPEENAERAHARAVSAEMHSGFAALRSEMPMNVRAAFPDFPKTAATERDIARIAGLWTDCRKAHGAKGAFLFGRFTIADAMFAPLVWRFKTYDVKLAGEAADYMAAMLDLPAMIAWAEAAMQEPWRVERLELAGASR
jgi:glutathione S-transferase